MAKPVPPQESRIYLSTFTGHLGSSTSTVVAWLVKPQQKLRQLRQKLRQTMNSRSFHESLQLFTFTSHITATTNKDQPRPTKSDFSNFLKTKSAILALLETPTPSIPFLVPQWLIVFHVCSHFCGCWPRPIKARNRWLKKGPASHDSGCFFFAPNETPLKHDLKQRKVRENGSPSIQLTKSPKKSLYLRFPAGCCCYCCLLDFKDNLKHPCTIVF